MEIYKEQCKYRRVYVKEIKSQSGDHPISIQRRSENPLHNFQLADAVLLGPIRGLHKATMEAMHPFSPLPFACLLKSKVGPRRQPTKNPTR